MFVIYSIQFNSIHEIQLHLTNHKRVKSVKSVKITECYGWDCFEYFSVQINAVGNL